MSSKLSAPPGKSWKITLRFLVESFDLPNNLLNLPEYEAIIFCKGPSGIRVRWDTCNQNLKHQFLQRINGSLQPWGKKKKSRIITTKKNYKKLKQRRAGSR